MFVLKWLFKVCTVPLTFSPFLTAAVMPVVSFVSGGLFLLKDTWMQHIQVAQGRIYRGIRKVQLEHLRHSFKDGLVGAGIGRPWPLESLVSGHV